MVKRYVPDGHWIYDPDSRELDSPRGCSVEDGAQFYADPRRIYTNMVVKNSSGRTPFFVSASELEQKVEVAKLETDDWKEVLPVVYIIGAGFIGGLVMMYFALRN